MLPVKHLINEPLSKHTSYRIGGPAKIFALPKTQEDIWSIGAYLLQTGEPYFVLGNGSNVLAPDEGFPGVVISTKELGPTIEFVADDLVRMGAGVLNARLLRACAERGLGGIEYLSGVPGNIGGAVFMNAGTASGWIQKVLTSVTLVNLKGGRREVIGSDLVFSYREQHFLQAGDLIFSCELRLKKDEPVAVKKVLTESIKRRKEAQPIEMPSCGSVFRNPEGENAWRLIEKAGLRGVSHGGACFSPKHANFIVNQGGATRDDVLFLIQLAKEKVYNSSGIQLQEEVVLLKPKKLK